MLSYGLRFVSSAVTGPGKYFGSESANDAAARCNTAPRDREDGSRPAYPSEAGEEPRMMNANLRHPGGLSARGVGVGFKAEHFDPIVETRPELGFFEVHAENYMGAGGPPHRRLDAIRERYPLSLHGVGLSIGSPGPLDRAHLQRLAAVARRFEPVLVSEHLAWSTHDGAFFNDLLPLPYTSETARPGRGPYRRGAKRAWSHDAARKSLDLRRVRREHDGGDRFLARDCAADRLRPLARHQQRLRQRDQSGLRSSSLSRRLSASSGGRNPPRGLRRGPRRRRPAAC